MLRKQSSFTSRLDLDTPTFKLPDTAPGKRLSGDFSHHVHIKIKSLFRSWALNIKLFVTCLWSLLRWLHTSQRCYTEQPQWKQCLMLYWLAKDQTQQRTVKDLIMEKAASQMGITYFQDSLNSLGALTFFTIKAIHIFKFLQLFAKGSLLVACLTERSRSSSRAP